MPRFNSEAKPMSARAFKQFRQELGLSERDASILLGMSRGFLRTCEEQGAPLYVAYACAALTKNIRPYGISDTVQWNGEVGAYKIQTKKQRKKKICA